MLDNVKTKRSGEPAWLKEELVVPEQQSALPGVTNRASYLHKVTLCFADEDSYNNDEIVEEIASKRT